MNDLPNGIHSIRREVQEDGTIADTTFVSMPISTASDPYVRTRLEPHGSDGSEVITEYAPAPERPESYPAALPFLSNRIVWTTESPNGRNLEGARWPGADVETLLSRVVESSSADGWIAIPHPPRAKLLGTPDVVLQKGHLYRELQMVRIDDTGLLQLWDVAVTWFDRKAAHKG